MPLLLDELTNLDNEIITLSQKFDAASEKKRNLTIDDIADSVLSIIPLFRNANVGIKTDADFSGLLTQLSQLHQSTNQAKYGLEYINPQKVINVVTSMLNLIEVPQEEVQRAERSEHKKESQHPSKKQRDE